MSTEEHFWISAVSLAIIILGLLLVWYKVRRVHLMGYAILEEARAANREAMHFLDSFER